MKINVEVKPSHKYLHVEMKGGKLYIYRSNKKHRGFLVYPEEIDNECYMGSVGNHVCLELEHFLDVSIRES